MPIITFSDGSKRVTKYDTAARLNEFLDNPELLDKITDPEERKKKEDFLIRVASIDFSDIRKPIETARPISAENPKVKAILNDKSLTGKAKFDAMRAAMGSVPIDKTEQV